MTSNHQSYQKPRGFSDILPGDVELWQEIEQTVHAVFQRYGYRELRPPIMEHTELFARSIGETTDIVEKEMFTIKREDGKNLSLRPEITASLCRSVLEHHLLEQEPFQKFYYIGPSFRYEKPQKGRQRQFHQIGVEALGGADPLLDLETIQLIQHLFDELGIDGYELHLNSMGCPDCRPSYRSTLKDHLRPRLDELCDNCQRRFDRNVFRVLDCKRDTCREHSTDVPHIYDHLCGACDDHWTEFIEQADRQGLDYQTNPRLVRGLDYYTRTVYEFRNPSLGAQNAIGGGGRYDGLMEELGGDPTPGIGFALGIERMILSLAEQDDAEEKHSQAPDAFFVYIDDECKRRAYDLVQTLRGKGLSADLNYEDRSVKAQMRVANRSGAPFVCILGPDELEQDQITVKEMESGDQEQIDLDDLTNYIS